MTRHPVIVLEFNELTPSLIGRFISDGNLPNFARFRAESRVFTTHADERPPYLDPWIQWVTVHSGLPHSKHGIDHLNEGHRLDAKRTWEVLAEGGHCTWVCGSMNVRQTTVANSYLLPDPWCTKVGPNPDTLRPYFRFVQQNVLEYTNDQVPLRASDYAEFLAFMIRRGLSATTVRAVTGQLLDERTNDSRWKRAVLLDLFQFDLFVHYYRRLAPSFSTFFLNSTAHYQHSYWDSMEPEHFKAASTADARYRDAILFGYRKMDALIGRFLNLASTSGATLILCTALSQQPSPDYDRRGSAVFYRPRNFVEFANAINLPGRYSVQPVMSEQFHLEFAGIDQADAAARHLSAVMVNGTRMLTVEQKGMRIFAGCDLHHDLPNDTAMTIDGRGIPFFELFYRMETSKTGMHHPDGILWIRLPDRRHQTTEGTVPLTAVAPTILKLFGASVPSQMATAPLPLS